VDNWYSKVAKTGLLGTKAKLSAETDRAEWSMPAKDPKDDAKKKAINLAMGMKKG